MRRRTKLRYSTDDFNRLLVKKDGKGYPVEGEFKIKKNNLIFLPERKFQFKKELDLAERIEFFGHWRLTDNRDLKLVLSETDYQRKSDELEIKGRIISCEANAIVFETRCKKTATQDKFSLLRLKGRWQTDDSNELNFLITKDIEDDILRFRGAWSVNQNHDIVYTYEKQDLVCKTTTQEIITLKGLWCIDARDRITYILDLKNKSFLEFKAHLERLDLLGDGKRIKYRIGIGVKDLKKERVFSLYGRWRIKQERGISFELDYGERGLRRIVFDADLFLDKNHKFVFELKNKRGEDLGISVTFKRNFLKGNSVLFSRLSKLENDKRLELGVRIPW